MPNCSNCYKTLDEGLNFCPYCGARVSHSGDKLCPSCNQIFNEYDGSFCGRCGSRLIVYEREQSTNGQHVINSVDDLIATINSFIPKIDSKADSISKEELLSFGNINNDRRYEIFYIPKKRRKYRMISSPTPRLKLILSCLNEIIYQHFAPAGYVTGFVRNLSIVDNGRIHVGQRYVYTIDLANFFESVTPDMIIPYLCKAPYNLNPEVADIVAKISCVKNRRKNSIGLSQGSPLSPVLSNIVCADLDKKLNGLASLYRAKYSRYADDITFSSSNNLYLQVNDFEKRIIEAVESSNFKINYNKIHLCGPQSRHYVTGIVTNSKVNVPREYISNIRNLLYIWSRYGVKEAYKRFDVWYKKYRKGKPTPFIGDFLRGKIEYLGAVRGKNDPIYKKFKNCLESLSQINFKTFYERPKRMKVSFNLSEPLVKYGRTYYTAETRYRGELVLISPKLNAYIESGVDYSPARVLATNCVVYKIFDKDGVKLLMTPEN